MDPLEKIDELQEKRGWNKDTMSALMKDFIMSLDLEEQLLIFLEKIAQDEAMDNFEYLSKEQVEKIRRRLMDVYKAGNGDETHSEEDAQRIYGSMNIHQLIVEIYDDEGAVKGLDFDPDTGEPWESNG